MTRANRHAFSAALVFALCGAGTALAQTAPPLGTAGQFGVLGSASVTGATGTGVLVNGDVGSSPTATITNFPPSRVAPPFTLHLVNDGVVQQAHTDALVAYNNLLAQGPGTVLADNLATVGVLAPGVYSLGAADLPTTATLTLNGNGIFIFNVASSLTANTLSNIVGTANPCNVYWRVGSSATLNGTTFAGTVIANTSITVGASANVTGRVLAGAVSSGSVTMAGAGGNTIGGCSSPPVAPVCPLITLSPATLPDGTVGAAYTQTILGSGGTAPYLMTLVGGALPAGLALTSAGVLAGTPTTAGSSTFTIRGTDANGCFVERSYTIVVAAAPPVPPVCPVITINPVTLPNGVVGTAYSQGMTGSGGTAPYTFGVTSGTLPAGLTLTAAGLLAGTPTTVGSSTFTIRGTDANGCFVERSYTIAVAAAPPVPPVCPVITLDPVTLPNGGVGIAYSQVLTGSGGEAPYTFGVTSGALPAGLTLTAQGLLAGTPTAVGSSVVTIRATDANGCFLERPYTIVVVTPPVVCPAITLAPPVLANGTVGTPYSQTITASGGTAPYVFTTAANTLPAGLTLSTAGALSGTPTAAVPQTFTVRGTDSLGCFALATFTVTIVESGVVPPPPIPPTPAVCPAITLFPAALPGGVVGVEYSQTLTASGGTAPYVFSTNAAALPPGMSLTSAGVLAGTPTSATPQTFTVRGTDALGCFAERPLSFVFGVAVPTMPQFTFVLLALGLMAIGYRRLQLTRLPR